MAEVNTEEKGARKHEEVTAEQLIEKEKTKGKDKVQEQEEAKEKTASDTNEPEPGMPKIKPVVIPADGLKTKRQKYISQFELVSHERGLLLCETYYDQKCMWQPEKGCFKMYIPVRQVHARSGEWYIYPAARLFAGPYQLCINLELNPKLRAIFSPRELKWEGNYLHIKYRKQRQKGIVLPAGMLLGYLYISEPWQERPTNYITTMPLYQLKYDK